VLFDDFSAQKKNSVVCLRYFKILNLIRPWPGFMPLTVPGLWQSNLCRKPTEILFEEEGASEETGCARKDFLNPQDIKQMRL
jgi:hypothetical protein